MKRSLADPNATLRQVSAVFENILAALPQGSATLKTESNEKAPGPSIALVPSNERSAEFGAVVMSDGLYTVFFGREATSTTFECPWDIHLPGSAGLDQQLDIVGKMCQAVIAGRCEHRIGRFSTQGRIHVSEKKIYRVGDLFLVVSVLPRRNPHVVQYEPYYPGAQNHSPSTKPPL